MLSTGNFLSQQTLRLFEVRDASMDVGVCDVPVDDFLALVSEEAIPSPFAPPCSDLMSLLVLDLAASVVILSPSLHKPLSHSNISRATLLTESNPTTRVCLSKLLK